MTSAKTSRIKLSLESSEDLYLVRREVGTFAREVGFSALDQVQICTAVSEIVRNVLLYAGKGGILARLSSDRIIIEVWDQGPGIPLELLEEIESGNYKSKTGLGKGITGARKLMDKLTILSIGQGTQVFLEKNLPD